MLTGEKEDIRKRKRGKGTLIIIDRKGKEVGRKEESESKSLGAWIATEEEEDRREDEKGKEH